LFQYDNRTLLQGGISMKYTKYTKSKTQSIKRATPANKKSKDDYYKVIHI